MGEMKENMKHVNDLRRFDFTPECKTCQYRKELGLLEYCCGFVFDEIRRQRFQQLKDTVYEYMDFSDELTVIDPDNILFQSDDEWSVTLTFKTNLKHDKKLILKQIREALLESIYFNNINFGKDSLYHKKFNYEPERFLQSTIEEFG